ncbi:MAG TPA: amidohydrolase [Candidatus Eisenbacteria bacterium]
MSPRAPRAGEFLFYNGRLLDATRAARPPRHGAAAHRPPRDAVWVKGERIEAVGPLAELRRRAGRAVEPVDLEGGTLTPGFTDAHIHLVTWIRALDEPWLDEQTPEGIARAAAARRSARGGGGRDSGDAWIAIRGWVPREWELSRRARATLDRVAPDRPLVLYAVDGHSVWANRAALVRAGVDERTASPSGGVIERDPGGRLTGVLIEDAANLVRSRVAHGEDPEESLRRALGKARSLGITSAHDYDRSATWRAAQDLDRAGTLGFRLLLSVPLASLDHAIALGLRSGAGNERLRIGAVKMFADGTLGSATALLEAPYEGGRAAGIEVTAADAMAEACQRAAQAGLTVAIHAIGDRAVRHALDAIEKPLRRGGSYPLPPRVEHVQLARLEDMGRFRALGAIASVQPIHLVTDRDVARRHWGARTERSYAYRRLEAAGARLAFGSDAPFDRAGPLLAIQAALLRRAGDEPEERAFHVEQRLTLTQALRAHLETPHRAAGWKTPLGRLAPGYGADLAQFDHDLLALPADSWHRAKVRAVWVAGSPEHLEK